MKVTARARNILRNTCCVVGFCLATILVADFAQAQYPVARSYAGGRSTYVPRTSPLPIYLQYFRNDVGVADPYNTFVRPRQELSQTLRQQQSRINALQSNQQAAQQFRGADQVAPTGVHAQFFNYSHYYPNNGRRR